jgi:hypothetical protein
MFKRNFIKTLYTLLFLFVSSKLGAIEIFCQSCGTIVDINMNGCCPHCSNDLTMFIFDESFFGGITDQITIGCLSKKLQDCNQKNKIPLNDFCAKKAFIRVKEILPDRQYLTIKKSSSGLELISMRESMKRSFLKHQNLTQEYINQVIVKHGFHYLPIQGGLFYPNGTVDLARWVTKQSRSRVLNLLFFFIRENHYEELIDDYHLVFVHIEGNEATIILPSDHNQFITIHFDTDITDNLINEYFQAALFSQLLVYHQDSHINQTKKKGKRKKGKKEK